MFANLATMAQSMIDIANETVVTYVSEFILFTNTFFTISVLADKKRTQRDIPAWVPIDSSCSLKLAPYVS